jgi:hypothetical protein
MKRMFNLSHQIVYYLLFMGCASTQSTTTGSSNKYSEDLSSLRPVFEEPIDNTTQLPQDDRKKTAYVEPRFTVNQQLHSVLDSIDRINAARKYVDGFTIQVYSGQKREDALNSKRTMDMALPELRAEMTYVQPTFRIKAGKYYTQLDAQKDFVEVKRYFPNAILIPEKISTD